MASTVGRINVCNQAIIKVGGNLITTLEDNSVEARICNETYDTVLRKALTEGDWSFSTAVDQLTTPIDPSDPHYHASNTWNFSFQLSDEFLRVIKVRNDGDFQFISDQHEIIDKTLMVNAESTWVKYIYNNQDHTMFSGDFVSVLALGVAIELCISITASGTLMDRLVGQYEMALNKARASDGRQSTNERVQSSWLTRGGRRSRLGGGSGYGGIGSA